MFCSTTTTSTSVAGLARHTSRVFSRLASRSPRKRLYDSSYYTSFSARSPPRSGLFQDS